MTALLSFLAGLLLWFIPLVLITGGPAAYSSDPTAKAPTEGKWGCPSGKNERDRSGEQFLGIPTWSRRAQISHGALALAASARS